VETVGIARPHTQRDHELAESLLARDRDQGNVLRLVVDLKGAAEVKRLWIAIRNGHDDNVRAHLLSRLHSITVEGVVHDLKSGCLEAGKRKAVTAICAEEENDWRRTQSGHGPIR
jgi:hypothetical protein